jgi:hypothetical protein
MHTNEDFIQYRGPDGKGWICDFCAKPIISAGDAYLEWVEARDESGAYKTRDLTLVHHLPASPRRQAHGCQFDDEVEFARDGGIVCGESLATFCGYDGHTLLLAMLRDGKSSPADVVEIIRRIHTPNYEHARLHIESACAEGIIEPNLPRGFLRQSELRAVLEWARQNGKVAQNRARMVPAEIVAALFPLANREGE